MTRTRTWLRIAPAGGALALTLCGLAPLACAPASGQAAAAEQGTHEAAAPAEGEDSASAPPSAAASAPDPNANASASAAASATPAASAPGASGSASASGSAVPEPALVDGCPKEMARIGRYCVDRWEAHLVTRAEDGSVANHPHNHRPEPGVRYEARSEPATFPQAYISRVESEAACKNAQKRLCSFIEWRRACQGPRWGRYPYATGYARRTTCNSGKDHLLTKFFGPNANTWKYEENFNAPELDIEPGFLAKTGEYENCATSEGVFDMVGNLHEWVSGSVDDRFMEVLDHDDVKRKTQHWRTGNGIFTGGFFSTTDQLGPGCLYTTVAHEPRYHDYSTGFRCCAQAVGADPVKPKPPAQAPRPPGKPKAKPVPTSAPGASAPR